MESSNFLADVKEQYDKYPYPTRHPQDEKKRLIAALHCFLETVNHYCFKGQKQLDQDLRILVAGGGTGDESIFLAEQLRGRGAIVTHLDLSVSAINIAKQRAQVRGLDNIEWVQASLLDLDKLELAPFDFITSSGVLHHLADPQAGLKALRSVLKPDGAAAIMVYGQYGRTGVYQMQELMRLVNHNETDLGAKVHNTKSMLALLPDSNWFKRGEALIKDHQDGDAAIYDLFLHSQDRAYTVPQIYEWVEASGFELTKFVYDPNNPKYRYDVRDVIDDEQLLKTVLSMDIPQQQAIAELCCGDLVQHFFYLKPVTPTADHCEASIDDLDMVPFIPWPLYSDDIYAQLGGQLGQMQAAGQTIEVNTNICKLKLQLSPHIGAIAGLIDGQRTIGQIIEAVLQVYSQEEGLNAETLHQELRVFYRSFNFYSLMLLRHKSVLPIPSLEELNARKDLFS